MRIRGILAVSVAALVVGCGPDTASPEIVRSDDVGGLVSADPSDVEIRVIYNDASLPPEFHRSTSMVVVDGRATAEVTDYDAVLAETTVDFGSQETSELLERIAEVDGESIEGDCTGGSSRAIVVTEVDTGDRLFELSADSCADDSDGLLDEMQDATAPLREAVDLGGLVASTTSD